MVAKTHQPDCNSGLNIYYNNISLDFWSMPLKMNVPIMGVNCFVISCMDRKEINETRFKDMPPTANQTDVNS